MSECIGLTLYTPQLLGLSIRKLATKGAKDEMDWIISGSSKSSEAGRAQAFWKDYPDDLGDIYGAHMKDQFHPPKEGSRRDYYETGYRGVMIPCVNSLQLFKRGDKVLGIVNQRSADMICGFPHDVLVWQGIANHLAGQPVPIRWNIGSAHVYDEHVEIAEKIVAEFSAVLADQTREDLPFDLWDFKDPFKENRFAFQQKAEVKFQGLNYYESTQ
jgi:hypothetical protein